jgi:hypothetical protein
MKLRHLTTPNNWFSAGRSASALLMLVAAVLVLLLTIACSESTPRSSGGEVYANEPTSTTSYPIRPTLSVYPEQREGYIPNPFMGWQDTEVQGKRFPETIGYVRDNWPEFQPAEDTYDWSIIEDLRERMVADGGKISFRIQTVKPPPWGSGHGVPDWLLAQGAQVVEGELSEEPLFADCLFLEAHGKFIDALRERYDGDPDVAFIDVGSYGLYGEWHTTQYTWEGETPDWHARRRIVDMYLGGEGTRPCIDTDGSTVMRSYEYEGFHETQLIMPYTPGFSDPFRYALSRRNDIGIRHDALGSQRHQDKYAEEISDLVEQTWRRAPIIFEFYPEAYTPDRLRSARAFAEDMHASIIHENFHGQGDDALIERLLERTGYRLVLYQATYTAEIRPGEPFILSLLWENRGVAPPYTNVPLLVQIVDDEGTVVARQQQEVDIRTWLPDMVIPVEMQLSLPQTLEAGVYDIQLAFVDPESQQPALSLAIEGQDAEGYYQPGSLNVLP